MTISGWFQLALSLLKLVNWITRKYDQATWKAAGYAEAMANETTMINQSVGWAAESLANAKNKSDNELDSRLGDDK